MRVLLNQDMDRVGRMGEVVEVADGYARNYLIPRNLAVAVTRGGVKEIEERKKVLDVKAERLRQQLESVADKIRAQKITIKARCSATGKLFGSITNRQLAAAIEQVTGEEIDRHKIIIEDRIRTVGTYHALLRLHHDVEIDLEFEVEGEGFVQEEPEHEDAPDSSTEAGEAVNADSSVGEQTPAGEEEGAALSASVSEEGTSESPSSERE